MKRPSRLARENERLREENCRLQHQTVFEARTREAKRMIAEAELHASILTAEDLVQFEPNTWHVLIRIALRLQRIELAERREVKELVS